VTRDHGPALLELTRARLLEVQREPEALFWMFVFPVLMALALGVAFPSRTTDTVVAGVVDGPGADAVAATIQRVPGVEVHRIAPADLDMTLRRATVQIVVEPGTPPTYRYDPIRSESRLARRVIDEALQRAAGRGDAFAPRDETVSTPGARYVDWLVPGLLGMTIMSTGLWGVGFSVVMARSRKLLRRLVATPMRRRDYLLAQALARLVFLVFEAGVLLLAARFLFGVPMLGSWTLLLSISLLGAVAFSALGLLAASRVQTVEALSGLLNLFILPMWIMSGVFFASSNFPAAVQPLVQALPLTALNNALRAVMLEGATAAMMPRDLAVLTAWGVGSFAVSLRVFRWR
jgi:ABC-type multidrug transport system permease subunit